MKLNRKLQPMVDGIDGNRRRWEELCSSYQQTRTASESNQSPEASPNPEPGQRGETNQVSEFNRNQEHEEPPEFGSNTESDQNLKCEAASVSEGNGRCGQPSQEQEVEV